VPSRCATNSTLVQGVRTRKSLNCREKPAVADAVPECYLPASFDRCLAISPISATQVCHSASRKSRYQKLQGRTATARGCGQRKVACTSKTRPASNGCGIPLREMMSQHGKARDPRKLACVGHIDSRHVWLHQSSNKRFPEVVPFPSVLLVKEPYLVFAPDVLRVRFFQSDTKVLASLAHLEATLLRDHRSWKSRAQCPSSSTAVDYSNDELPFLELDMRIAEHTNTTFEIVCFDVQLDCARMLATICKMILLQRRRRNC